MYFMPIIAMYRVSHLSIDILLHYAFDFFLFDSLFLKKNVVLHTLFVVIYSFQNNISDNNIFYCYLSFLLF